MFETTGETLKRLRGERQNAISAGMRKHWEKRRITLAARLPKASVAVPAGPIIHPQDNATRVFVPERVMADRDRRALLEPRSLTAELLGDPLPGRSALDRRTK